MIGSISNRSTFIARSLKPRKAISVSTHHDDLQSFTPNRNKCSQLTQGAYFRSHARSVNQHVQISQGLLIDVHNHLLYFLYACHHIQISHERPIDAPNHLLCILHVHHRIQKARSSRSTLHTTFINFSMHSAVYKKIRGYLGMCYRFSI
jgi:hypothetical protein